MAGTVGMVRSLGWALAGLVLIAEFFMATLRASPGVVGTPPSPAPEEIPAFFADNFTANTLTAVVIEVLDAVQTVQNGSDRPADTETQEALRAFEPGPRLWPEYPLRVSPIKKADPELEKLENLPTPLSPLSPMGPQTPMRASTPLFPVPLGTGNPKSLDEVVSDPSDDVKIAGVIGAWAEAGASLSLAVRPREFTFTELLLNPAHDPQCFIAGLGLHLAVAVGDSRLLERLLQLGEDPNTLQTIPGSVLPVFDDKNVRGYLSKDPALTPLMLATLTRQERFVRLLLRYGADKERIHTRKFHFYPLDFAAQRGDVPMMQLLLGRDSLSETDRRRIVVSLSGQSVHLLLGGEAMLASPVSTGKPGFCTPPGEYVVTQKYRIWKSSLYKVPMPNFMRLNCGSIGLHGGYVPDVPASHGCIRLPPENAAAFYSIVRIGDLVSIIP